METPKFSFEPPRFSLETSRFSLETPRISLETPRISLGDPGFCWRLLLESGDPQIFIGDPIFSLKTPRISFGDPSFSLETSDIRWRPQDFQIFGVSNENLRAPRKSLVSPMKILGVFNETSMVVSNERGSPIVLQ